MNFCNSTSKSSFFIVILQLIYLEAIAISNHNMMQTPSSILLESDSDDLQNQLELLKNRINTLASQGQYILAQQCQKNAQELEKDIKEKQKQQLKVRQKEEIKEVRSFLKEDLKNLKEEWNQKIVKHKAKTELLRQTLNKKHEKEWQNQLARLEKEVPCKGKQSSELLNLRKMEESLAKLQNYKEAKIVQAKVREWEKKEAKEWEKAKKEKVASEMKLLKTKQENEIKVLNKKLQTQLWELEMERTKIEAETVLKHTNIKRQIKSQNRKENLMASGTFKSRADLLSSSRSILSPTKSRILSNSRSQKFLNTNS